MLLPIAIRQGASAVVVCLRLVHRIVDRRIVGVIFVNYRQVVLSADQKEYKITQSVQGGKITKVILQLLAICYFQDGYVWWMILEVLMAVATSYVLDRSIRREYPWLRSQSG